MISQIAHAQWGEERNLRRQLAANGLGMQQAAPLSQVEKHLAVGLGEPLRPHRPVNGLGQTGVIDEAAVLLRETRRRQHMAASALAGDANRSCTTSNGIFRKLSTCPAVIQFPSRGG